METVEGVKQLRIVQEKRERIHVYLVKKDDESEDITASSIRALNSLLFGEMVIEVSIVNEIPGEYAGKIRAVISKGSNNDS